MGETEPSSKLEISVEKTMQRDDVEEGDSGVMSNH